MCRRAYHQQLAFAIPTTNTQQLYIAQSSYTSRPRGCGGRRSCSGLCGGTCGFERRHGCGYHTTGWNGYYSTSTLTHQGPIESQDLEQTSVTQPQQIIVYQGRERRCRKEKRQGPHGPIGLLVWGAKLGYEKFQESQKKKEEVRRQQMEILEGSRFAEMSLRDHDAQRETRAQRERSAERDWVDGDEKEREGEERNEVELEGDVPPPSYEVAMKQG